MLPMNSAVWILLGSLESNRGFKGVNKKNQAHVHAHRGCFEDAYNILRGQVSFKGCQTNICEISTHPEAHMINWLQRLFAVGESTF